MSALETLLEAARYIELQEQQQLASSPSPTSLSSSSSSSSSSSISFSSSATNLGRYHQLSHSSNNNINNNNTNSIDSCNNSSSNSSNSSSRNGTRHHEVSGTQTSLIFATGGSGSCIGNGNINIGIGGGNSNNNNNNNNNNNSNINNSNSPSILGCSSTDYHRTSTPSSILRTIEGRLSNSNSSGIGSTLTNSSSNVHHVLSASIEDSSQSSLNFSNGYLSGSSVNSNVGSGGGGGGGSSSSGGGSNLNLTNSPSGIILNPLFNDGDHHMQTAQPTTITTSGRRRTTSTNSNGGTQRSPCILRAGTREVHNKLEKHRRAHLKECFEQLKVQLESKDEEKKKTSNLAILGSAYRCVMQLKRKERELEQEVEQLAKDKIVFQKRILSLKRELSARYDNNDIANIVADSDIGNIPGDRDSVADLVSPLLSGRSSTRYSSSSSLSSGAPVSSPLGSGVSLQTVMPTAISPVISVSSSTSPSTSHLKSLSPLGSSMPLSLTTKNLSSSNLARGSPTLLIPSPSPSSCMSSSSPPVVSSSSSSVGITQLVSSASTLTSATSIGIKIPNVPNGVKLTSTSPPSVGFVSSTSNCTSSPVINLSSSESGVLPSAILTSTGIPLSLNGSQNVPILSAAKDLNNKNGICRKTPETRVSSPSNMILTATAAATSSTTVNATNLGNAKEIKIEKIFDGSEQPTKVIKLLNGIALAPVDKDNKLLSSAPLTLSHVVGGGGLVVSPFPMITSPQGLRVIGQAPNGLATIELSSSTVQQQTRNHQQSASPPVSSVTATSGAQLHKLLVSGGTTATAITTGNSVSGATNSSITHVTSGAPELARLPGGAELNILPTGANGTTTLYRGSGKLAIVNNGITLKEATGAPGRAVHVVTPLQPGTTPISGLTPIASSNLAHILASSPQLAGKVNLSVGGSTLPLISTQYLSSMKPMVVAVASNTNPTLSSVPPTSTSAAATATANGGSS